MQVAGHAEDDHVRDGCRIHLEVRAVQAVRKKKTFSWGGGPRISANLDPPFPGLRFSGAFIFFSCIVTALRSEESHGRIGKSSDGKMIIPVSIDKAAQAEAQGAGGVGGKGGQTKTNGVCVPEWSMVELQGELVSKDPMSGQPLGSMTSENVSRTFCMTRGIWNVMVFSAGPCESCSGTKHWFEV